MTYKTIQTDCLVRSSSDIPGVQDKSRESLQRTKVKCKTHHIGECSF